MTGHRTATLNKHNYKEEELANTLEKIFLKLKPTKVISGMALGVDTIAAEVAIKLKIPIVAAIPYPSQCAGWSKANQNRYQAIFEAAADAQVLFDDPEHFGEAVKYLHKRNEWMVDRADLLIGVWDGSKKGGTAHCIRYAGRVSSTTGLRVLRINPATGKLEKLY